MENEELKKEWKYTAVGNVVKDRFDENCVLRHGTKEFRSGTKLYLYGKYWDETCKKISAIGFDRHKRFRVVDLPVEFVENTRLQKVYIPQVLEIMNNFEFEQGWWNNTKEDKKSIQEFLTRWNNKDNFSIEGYKKYKEDIENILKNKSTNKNEIDLLILEYYNVILDAYRKGKKLEDIVDYLIKSM